jgi:hypothetical protein
LFGQTDENTITITAYRQVTLQPDQMLFGVSVTAAETAGLDDVLAMLPGTGITGSNLTGVFGFTGSAVAWSFQYAVPLAQSGATVALLSQLDKQSGDSITFSPEGTQVSQGLQQSQPCSQTALVGDARAQAQSLAAAAGYTVGPVLAVSDGTGMQAPSAVYANAESGVLTLVGTAANFESFLSAAPAPATCAAVVKFQLFSYH